MITVKIRAKQYVDGLGIYEKFLIFTKTSIYYVMFDDDVPVCVLACKITPKTHRFKVQGIVTFKHLRGKGYATKMLEFIIKNFSNYDIYADCLKTSISMFTKCGFELLRIKQFKEFIIYYVVKRRNC